MQYRVVTPNGRWESFSREEIEKAVEESEFPPGTEVVTYERRVSLDEFVAGPRAFVPPTDRQMEFALELGVDIPNGVSRRELSRMIDQAQDERSAAEFERWERISEKREGVCDELRRELRDEILNECGALANVTLADVESEFHRRGIGLICIAVDLNEFECAKETREKASLQCEYSEEFKPEYLVHLLESTAEFYSDLHGVRGRITEFERALKTLEKSTKMNEELMRQLESNQHSS